jgi:hypothetical protein
VRLDPDMTVVTTFVAILVGGALNGADQPPDSASGAKNIRRAVPADAMQLISTVATLSAARDLVGIRKVMTEPFVWSFGGDDSPDSALDEWRRDPRYLSALSKVLKMRCRSKDYNGVPGVECPGRGGLSFRAWFVETPAGWGFTAFVEGD